MSGRRHHREAGSFVATLTACYAETLGKAVGSQLRSSNGPGKMDSSVSGPPGNRRGLPGVLEA